MRSLAFAFVISAVSVAALGGCADDPRIQSFTGAPAGGFTYAVHTSTVMTANDDGAAEQIRRDWLAQTLEAQGLCRGGYVIHRRQLVVPPQRPAFNSPPDDLAFGNSGDVVYDGNCL